MNKLEEWWRDNCETLNVIEMISQEAFKEGMLAAAALRNNIATICDKEDGPCEECQEIAYALDDYQQLINKAAEELW